LQIAPHRPNPSAEACKSLNPGPPSVPLGVVYTSHLETHDTLATPRHPRVTHAAAYSSAWHMHPFPRCTRPAACR
jgi:hypothetical protein